jgi:two-component system chemotaxis sensor kinase CheA
VDLEKYRVLFVEEATDHLAEMSSALVALEAGGSASDLEPAVDSLFRLAHSIKGMSASLDYTPIAELAHRLEDWMEPLRQGSPLPEDGIALLSETLRALEEMVAQVAERGAVPAPRPDLVSRLSGEADGPPAAPLDAAPAGPTEPAGSAPLPRSVRVRTETVDRFLAAVGELMQRQARLETLHRSAPFWAEYREFGEELDGMEHVVRELRRRALDIRTTPVRRVLERLPRVASELARELSKRVRVELAGEKVELDRAVLDHVNEPLLHLLRNAVDHGIETPETRERAGKPPVGCIRVGASRVGGRVRIRLEEDGGGIDVEAVRRKAVERGLLLDAVAEDLPVERICELVFEPGISAREAVSEVSGRGVGLDAVKRTVEGLGGSISVETEPGHGTAFEMDLPSMVALQRVLVLELDGERVALPAVRVESVLGADEGRVEGAAVDAFFVFKDEPIPLLDLAYALGLPSRPEGGGGSVVVLETQGFRLGLRVDRAVADLEVFVREVPAVLAPLDLVGGVAILPDGVPVFLLEVAALMEEPV